jgi:ABC-type multidrug transport system ATPase subunit
LQITLTNTGKRYNREWIFRGLNQVFLPGKNYAVTGPNGSGKSTLLQVIAGAIMQTEGVVEYIDTGNWLSDKNDPISKTTLDPASSIQHPVSSIQHPISPINAHKHLSFAAPYLELIEEMTATELLQFHSTFKQLSKPIAEILEVVSLGNAAHKQIRYFSSGMKQRLKLAQAFFTNTPLLLLDEPTTNLDSDGIALYHQLVKNHARGKLIIISSNDIEEYSFCEVVIPIINYK